ncbi:MAG TPA: thiamine pyrophosphate-dependent enzyme [Methanomicrobiales archaeon]|nr:thiamine pyrophosphate-dependent enzyme [Methanomicrobiales archaeon]
MARWLCTVCGYVYDEEAGEPLTGTPPGTRFADLPDGWKCPVCGSGKEVFVREGGEAPAAPATPTTVSDVIMANLAAWGVSLVFGIPGTSSLGLVDAVRKRPDMRYIVVRHEENAAFAASAYNKFTGGLAACLTIAGPGATNLATGLYDAKEDGASVISLNGQVEIQYTGPGGFQEIDQDAFFRPVTVFNNTIAGPEMTVTILEKALRLALLGRGVSQVSVPNDVQKEPLAATSCRRETCIPDPDILPPEKELRRAAELISSGSRPVILAGWGAFPDAGLVSALAGKIQAPVLTTFRAKGILPYDHPWFVSVLGTVGMPEARVLAQEADPLICLGVGFSKQTNVPLDRPMVQVDLDPVKLGKGTSSVSLWGNCHAALPRLVELVAPREDPAIRARVAGLKEAILKRLEAEADPRAVPVRPPYIMKVLSETIPEDALITIDVGENGWWFGRNFRMKRQRFAMSGYLATMGFGLPAAIAAKLAYPDRKVFCITGDGGFAMGMAEVVTAVKYHLPMVIVIMDNRELGMIRVEQQMEHYPNFGTDLLNPDFAAYADACGGEGIRVSRPDELEPAIRRAMELDTVVIVDVETDVRRFV